MFNRDRLLYVWTALMIFMIPTSRVIGDNGCGYLSGTLEIFWCLSLLAGAGLTVTMRGLMRDRIRRNQYTNASQVFTLGKRYAFIAAFVLLLLNTCVIVPMCGRIFSGGGTSLIYVFIGPALFLSVFINLNIGYLSGTDNNRATVIGEIIYGVTSGLGMLAGSILGHRYGLNIAALLRNEDVSAMYGAIGAMMGICIAEVITLILLSAMTIIYQRTFRHLMRTEESRRHEHLSDVMGRFFGGIFANGVQEFIIHAPILLALILFRKYGVSAGMSDVGEAVGAFYSKYVSIISILSVLSIISVQGSMNGIVAAASESDNQLVADRITRMFARVTYFAIPAVIFVTMLATVIVSTIFTGRQTTVIQLFTIGSAVIILYGVMHAFVSALIRLGYNKEMLVISFLALIVGASVTFVLMFKRDGGLTGAVMGIMIDYALCALVCFIILYRNYRIRFRVVWTVLLPLVVAGLLGLAIRMISTPLFSALGGVLTLIICVIPAWFAYNVACMFLRVVSASAMSKKLFGQMFVKIGQEIGVY